MTRSLDEQAIRNEVVVRLRELLPGARIIHELNVAGQGTNRIDVAAVTTNHIVGVEIKSKKDTLKRLEEQWTAFRKCCHLVIVAAHEKHFAEYREPCYRDDVPPEIDLNHPLFLGKFGMRDHVWRFPPPAPLPTPERLGRFTYRQGECWLFDPWRDIFPKLPPASCDLLQMLWATELQHECHRHGVPVAARSTRFTMIREMALGMSGREVAQAVCRQLRARTFAEADPPIALKSGAAPPTGPTQPSQISGGTTP
ncbi:hypothetical protein [Shinella pollutisoli]|uniref:NERD domain-containing protein n=1 Tax=Shinella pollutisoli TaxID=2250594 RepID=A0ABV7DJ16_9HYPH|nr:hypothetical protein [Shinella pollutisoli]